MKCPAILYEHRTTKCTEIVHENKMRCSDSIFQYTVIVSRCKIAYCGPGSMSMITVEYMRYGVVDYQSTYSLLAGDDTPREQVLCWELWYLVVLWFKVHTGAFSRAGSH